MFLRTFHPTGFLRGVYGTEPFADYCRSRGIGFLQDASKAMRPADVSRWMAALAELSSDAQAVIELELAKVNEMAGREALADLTDAVAGRELPPATVPAGAPLALWFLLHYPAVFHEVFLRHEIREAGAWRIGRGPAGIALDDLQGKTVALAERLKEFFGVLELTGRFCAVHARRLPEGFCFSAQVADRLQFVEIFTDSGKPATHRVRPAIPVLFVYRPGSGTVLLKSHLRADDRVLELFQAFGQAVLDGPVEHVASAFNLDILKSPFHPLPEEEDIESVRVKALHLKHPASSARRHLKLETRSDDEPTAIDHLLAAHVSPNLLAQMQVSYAEVQVRLRIDGRRKNIPVRLWRNRCSLNQTPLAERLRTYLKRWNLAYAE